MQFNSSLFQIVQSYPELDFDLTDPNAHRTPTQYDSLHDPHLNKWFGNKLVREHLLKKGLIDEDGKVLCDLKTFNKYRAYLDTVYLQLERKEVCTSHLFSPRPQWAVRGVCTLP